jgi:hypothetical protein
MGGHRPVKMLRKNAQSIKINNFFTKNNSSMLLTRHALLFKILNLFTDVFIKALMLKHFNTYQPSAQMLQLFST